jgi:HPt (histidine-containing phosphotransfer) domain-containing protein
VTLKAAHADGDCAAIALVAHSLKSSSGNVGEAQTSTCCRELEMAARSNDLAACGPLISQVEDLLAVHAEIRQMFDRAAKAS